MLVCIKLKLRLIILFYLFWYSWPQPKPKRDKGTLIEGDTAVPPVHTFKVHTAYSKNCKQITIQEGKILGLPN